ncbi:hypothetical protein WUBG_14296 [Wuchereria bancrofti]|uniref:C2H2-type domain-containing protein n=1 Tax=Wuchereria bancrofti TaxID=6293 RepID=J9ECN2_WUCBA|nr:hypothetical protein WUBG_14296 [Wuchereria bancrofti]
MARTERPLFCEVCLRTFADRKAMEQHESYHKRVHLLIEHGDLEIPVLMEKFLILYLRTIRVVGDSRNVTMISIKRKNYKPGNGWLKLQIIWVDEEDLTLI